MHKMSLRETQLATKELLKQFDKLCSKLHIKYFLLFGSLLGAVRHKGFIPWDDDLDIGMMPEDYKVLKDFFYNHSNYTLELHSPETKSDCYFNISRICEKQHKLIFKHGGYESGLFIDIYVLEGLGGKKDFKYWDGQFKKIIKWRKRIFMSINSSVLYGKSLVTQLANIPFVIISHIRGKDYYFSLLNSHKVFDIETSEFLGIPKWETVRYPKSCFQSLIRVPFEDIMVTIPANYDTLLSIEYGNYMSLPDKKDRVPYHGYEAYSLD